MTEGNPTVEEARSQVLLWTQPYAGIARSGFASDLDDLIEAVRQEERERVGSVTRVEVIDYRRDPARCYAEWGIGAELAYQDEGRTLKVFVRGRAEELTDLIQGEV
jgi:hypothetical protein